MKTRARMKRESKRCTHTRLLLLWLLVSWRHADVAAFPKPLSTCKPLDNHGNFTADCRYTCLGNCGGRPVEHSGLCGCDKDCQLYGDCCSDYFSSCLDEAADEEDGGTRHRLFSGGRCIYTHSPFHGAVNMLISDCHPDWDGEGAEEHCRGTPSNLLGYIPVTDTSTGVFYSSAYCAKCNFAQLGSNLVMWKAEAKCHYNTTGDDDLLVALQRDECQLVLEHPQGSAKPRFCPRMLETACDPRCTDQELRQKCESWPVMTPTTVYSLEAGRDVGYKNKYCAACMGASLAQMNCLAASFYTPNLGQFSFALLADFDPSAGCVGYRERQGRESVQVCDGLLDNGEKEGEEEEMVSGEFRSVLASNHSVACNETAASSVNCTMEFFPDPQQRLFVDSKYSEWLGALSLGCVTASIVCLVVRLVLQFYVPCLRGLGGKTQFCLCLTLLVAMVSFIIGPLVKETVWLCKVLAMLMHWAFLASFFWMNVIAIDMWQIFRPASSFSIRSPRKQRRLLAYFCLYAWLVPLLVVLCAYSLDLANSTSRFRPHYGAGVCWIAQKFALLLFFGVPLAGLILANCVLYVITSRYLHSSMTVASTVKRATEGREYQFGVYIKLFVLMGCAWASAFVATFAGSDVVWGIYTVLTSTQGVYISLAAVCSRQVRRSLCGKPDSVTTQRTQKMSIYSTSSRSKSIISSTSIHTA